MVATEIESVTALMSAAVAAGVVHTWLGPDHYLPLLGFAKLERWSRRRAMLVTAVVGLAHCLLALPVVFAASATASVLDLQLTAAQPLAWLGIGLGLALLVTAVRRRRAGGGEIEPVRSHRRVRWLWLAAFVLGPCEWLWPCAMPALQAHGAGGLLLVTAAYTAATIAAMVAAVAVGMTAAVRWRPAPAAAQAVLGGVLMASGGVVLLGL